MISFRMFIQKHILLRRWSIRNLLTVIFVSFSLPTALSWRVEQTETKTMKFFRSHWNELTLSPWRWAIQRKHFELHFSLFMNCVFIGNCHANRKCWKLRQRSRHPFRIHSFRQLKFFLYILFVLIEIYGTPNSREVENRRVFLVKYSGANECWRIRKKIAIEMKESNKMSIKY